MAGQVSSGITFPGLTSTSTSLVMVMGGRDVHGGSGLAMFLYAFFW